MPGHYPVPPGIPGAQSCGSVDGCVDCFNSWLSSLLIILKSGVDRLDTVDNFRTACEVFV